MLVWGALVTVGLAGLTRYSLTPGASARASSHWPHAISFQPRACDLTLVVSIHSKCPCSRATVAELARLLSRFPSKIHAYVLLVQPDASTQLVPVRQLSNVTIISDESGTLSDQFGAMTSGQTFAFDRAGRLRFSGGITASRGHEGDNAGSDAIAAIAAMVTNENLTTQQTPVFGCPLGAPGAGARSDTK